MHSNIFPLAKEVSLSQNVIKDRLTLLPFDKYKKS